MTDEEKKIVHLLAQKLTGAHPDGTYQHEIFITNVEKRMHEKGIETLSEYLSFVKEDEDENAHLISTLSIHTTSWFRENPHYVILQRILLNRGQKTSPYRVWSCACSTGEEVYSFAVLFEEFKGFHPDFTYSILGTDIDPISLNVAKHAVYEKKNLSSPLSYYKKHVLLGSDHTENYFTFTKSIRQRCEFRAHDIRELLSSTEPFDLIVCRNVLIYFSQSEVQRVIQRLISQLRPGGHLILGHSEMIDHEKMGLSLRGHAVYRKNEANEVTAHNRKPKEYTPPVRTIPLPQPKILKKIDPNFNADVILIGASTGGPQAIASVLANVNDQWPPIIVIQHIAAQFAQGFAANLSHTTGLRLGSTADGTKLERGHLYLADGNYHIGVKRSLDGITIQRSNDPPINSHRPSVDFLFMSALSSANSIAILLSGMGHDGAKGMGMLHNKGAYTVAQCEADCVVYGMPKEAIDTKSVDYIGSGEQIGKMLSDFFQYQITASAKHFP